MGVAPNQKNGGKNFGGGKQEVNLLREVWGRPALKTCFSKNFGTNTGSNPLREVQGGDPESNIREKLDGKAVFFGVAPNQKNGGKNFGGGKQEGNSLREVCGRPALKTCFSKNFGANTGSNPLWE